MALEYNVSKQEYHDQFSKTEAARIQCIHYTVGTDPLLPAHWNVKDIYDHQQRVLEERKRRGEA